MIALDQQQERVLADVAAIIRRSHGNEAAERYLRTSRRIAILMLSISQWLAPRRFAEWNRQRIEGQS